MDLPLGEDDFDSMLLWDEAEDGDKKPPDTAQEHNGNDNQDKDTSDSTQKTGNEAEQLSDPFLNTFISAMAGKSTSEEQSTPSNVLNAITGLPLFVNPSDKVNQNNTFGYAMNTDAINEYSAALNQQSQFQQSQVPKVEPIFPPNFFLNGLPLWDPSQASVNIQSSQVNKNNMVAENKNAPPLLNIDGAKFQSQSVLDPSNMFQAQALSKEQQQLADNDWNHVQVSKHIEMHRTNQQGIDPSVHQMSISTRNSNINMHIEDSKPAAKPSVQQHPQLQEKFSIHSISDNDSSSNSHFYSNHSSSQQKKRSKPQSQQSGKGQLPPFYLFDAPAELRHNFIQAQKAMNIPVLKDTNSYHYGLASKNMQIQMDNANCMSSMLPHGSGSVSDMKLHNGPKVKLLDARQKKGKRGNDRNEREQQRAQKITELIEQLRTTMMEGGWSVEMKSKYQTLSTCAEYVKHLKKMSKEKEELLAKTKSDLAIRDEKMQEEKVMQDSRSDPESVISSLTAFSTSSSHVQRISTNDSDKNTYKDKISNCTSEGSSNQINKKQSNDDGSGFSSDTGHKGNDISVNKMSSSVSDMTDSNKGSSDSKDSNNMSVCDLKHSTVSNENCSQKSGEIEVSSTAAVVSGIGSQDNSHEHADVIVKTGSKIDRKRKHDEKNSLHDDFVLDFKEVFMRSNVPQIVATIAGRIVTGNDFFHRLTGLSKQEMRRITIFSIVQAEYLSVLYELIAESLRQNNSKSDCTSTVPSLSSSKSETDSNENSDAHDDCKSISLPCVKFPNELIGLNGQKNCSLYMHVTFIRDEITSKRCLHCALTDRAGKDDNIGVISPTLLRSIMNS